MDEAFALAGPFAHLRPVRLNNESYFKAKFKHSLSPWPKEVSQHFHHHHVYDPDVKWRGGECAERQIGGLDMEVRLKANDAEKIDVQFLFPTLIGIPCMAVGPVAAELCRAYNDWTKKLVAGREDRLKPIAILPWGYPEGMVAELERCVKELGFKAAHVMPYHAPTGGEKRTIDNPVYYPFYAAAERLDVPLMLHPNSQGELINLYDNFYAMHVLGRPFNCTAGLVALVVGGIFERFPNLRVAFFECSAEWILYWMHRMDDDYKRMKDDMAPKIAKTPSAYIKKNCYVTCEADERDLKYAIEHFSEDRILMASDYPHFDSEYPGTVREIMERNDITKKQKEKILSENAREFLRV